jgi:hypothetical protein
MSNKIKGRVIQEETAAWSGIKGAKLRDRRVMTYKGFTIFKLVGFESYQVRWYQRDLGLWHVWNPWADSLKEAKVIADRLVAAAAAL